MGTLGYAIGAFAPAFAIAICCYAACMGSARQPEIAGRLFTNFIIGAAFAEALGLIGFVALFVA